MCEKMINVNSSNIKSIGYDENLKIACVEFLHGGLYNYEGVSLGEFNNLQNAQSIGTYLNINFKNRYPYKRIR
jgi:hypothetical protein